MAANKKKGSIKPAITPQDETPRPAAPAEKKRNTSPVEESAPVADLFDKLGNKAQFVAIGLIVLMGFFVYRDFLLFQKAFLYRDIGSDSMNMLYPYISSITNFISQHKLPGWSFNTGMGQNIVAYTFRDPFDIIFYLFGKSSIVFGIGYKEYIKLLGAGIVFFYYLRSLHLSTYVQITGSFFFAFCSYIIVGSCWQVHSLEVFEMALLLLSFEQLFQKGKWVLFPIPFFMIAISQPFNVYLYGMFIALYAMLRLFQTDSFTAKNAAMLYGKMAGTGVLGLMLGAPFLLENIAMILESPRGSGESSYAHILAATPMFQTADKTQIGTDILRFFSTDILGSGNDFKGVGNILEAPLFYCGLPCLLLMPQLFQFLNKKAKIAFIALLAAVLMPVIFPYFRYAFFLFSGDYYRAYSFFVSFIFIFYSVLALDFIVKQRKISMVTLIVTVVLLLALLNYPYFPDKDFISSPVLTFVCFFLILYAVLLFLIPRIKDAATIKYAFFGIVMFEMVYFSSTSINDRDIVTATELSQKYAFNDYTVDALAYVNKQDKSFFRIDKSYSSSTAMHYNLNDAMVQNYHGTSSYSSFNQQYYIYYMELMGLINKQNEVESRWSSGLSTRPILESENSVKYIFAKTQINPIWRITTDSIATFGDVKVFQNKFLVPFGYCYGNYIKESDFQKLSNTQKDFTTLKTVAVADKDLGKISGLPAFDLKDTIAATAFNVDIYAQAVKQLSTDTLTITTFADNLLQGKINVSDNKIMYISIPYDGGWTLKVDGQKQDKLVLNGGMTGVWLPKGAHTVEMRYELRYFMKGVYLCLFGLLLYVGVWFLTRKKQVGTVAAEE